MIVSTATALVSAHLIRFNADVYDCPGNGALRIVRRWLSPIF